MSNLFGYKLTSENQSSVSLPKVGAAPSGPSQASVDLPNEETTKYVLKVKLSDYSGEDPLYDNLQLTKFLYDSSDNVIDVITFFENTYPFGEATLSDIEIPFTSEVFTSGEFGDEVRIKSNLSVQPILVEATVLEEQSSQFYPEILVESEDKKDVIVGIGRDENGEINVVTVNGVLVTSLSTDPSSNLLQLSGVTPDSNLFGFTKAVPQTESLFSPKVGGLISGPVPFDPSPEKDFYQPGDVIVILGSSVGGEDGVDDVTLTFTSNSIVTTLDRYSFPTIDTSKGEVFNHTWGECSSLAFFPPLDTSSGTNFGEAWFGCESLVSFPEIDTSSGTNFAGAWEGCSNLTSFPLLDTSSGTDFRSAWAFCSSLTSFPLLNTSSGTNFAGAWEGCSNLTSFPLLDTSSGTNFSGAWYNCSSLTTFPELDFSSGTSFEFAWYNCSSLTTFPAGMFDTCSATDFFLTWQNCALSQQSVDNILISLDNAGQTSGVVEINSGTSSAPGAAGIIARDSLIAKGWSVFTN